MEQKKNRILCTAACILMLVSAVVMYLTHRAVPFMMDDLWYATMLSSQEPIKGLSDIIESQIWHYYNWGGRSLTHGILQLTLLAGETAADVLNVAMTFLLGWVICLAADIRGKGRRVIALWACVGMVLGLNANWKMSMFWQAGAANYLYITVFILLFLYCYLREVGTDDVAGAFGGAREQYPKAQEKSLPGIALWIIPLGILAGWSNENMGPAVFLVSIIVIWLKWKEQRKVSVWMVLGSLSCLAGSILVVAAPGNFVRSARVEENQYGIWWRIFLRCYAECKAAMEYLFLALLLLAAVLFVAKGVLKLTIGRKNLLLLFCALLSWGAMILSPHYPDRAAFGTMVLLICVILSLTGRILEKRQDLSGAAMGIGALIWLRGMFFLGEFLAISWGWIK